jgi:hypothetical protein
VIDDHFIQQLKELRCGPCKDDRGIDRLAHVLWFIRKDDLSDEVGVLPLCLECAKLMFSRFGEPFN